MKDKSNTENEASENSDMDDGTRTYKEHTSDSVSSERSTDRTWGRVLFEIKSGGVEIKGLLQPDYYKQKDIGHQIGRTIAGLRAEKGWNQQETAEKIGKTRSWLSKIENGSLKFQVADLVEIARVFDTPLDQIVPPSRDLEQIQSEVKDNPGSIFFLTRLKGSAVDSAVASEMHINQPEKDAISVALADLAAHSLNKCIKSYFRAEAKRIRDFYLKRPGLHELTKDRYFEVLHQHSEEGSFINVVITSTSGALVEESESKTISPDV